MKIREAAVADSEIIARVHVDSWRTTYAGILSEDYLANLSVEKRKKSWDWTFRNLNKDENIFVCEDSSGQIVGFVNGGVERSGEYPYTGELYAIYLLKEYQGRGIGSQLFKIMAEWLHEKGHLSMLLWVLEANKSAGFYTRMGGQVVGDKMIKIGDDELKELAVGWSDIRQTVRKER
ncbi:GNAT family N-acetyltransferase [Paenibacillus hamazuiensis]|uniref:GNAT family N-acetyltransferase n=1 Tax=Paenibacillus hamazuiensis TaxID=2936508 RepID=UPI00200CAF21|nr:GNAT family N-acetyltransferase [Paenibacillus hamazuiensis]